MQKDEELLVALRKVIRAIDLRSKQLSKSIGLTGPQLLVMRFLGNHSGAMVRQIADHVNLSSATITNIVDRLESRELVQKIRSTEDKRRVGVYLSDKGQEILERAPMPFQEHFINRFSKLEEWEKSQMVATLQRLAHMMDAEDIDVSPVLEVGDLIDNKALEKPE